MTMLLQVMNFLIFTVHRARAVLWGFVFQKTGRQVYISSSFFASAPQNIELGDKISINRAVHLDGIGGLKIGSGVLIVPNTKIYSANHHFSVGTDIFSTPLLSKLRVTIGNNIWIGANVIILPGVSVPNNTVIAGGSVVTKCGVAEYKVYAGNPAKVISEWPSDANG